MIVRCGMVVVAFDGAGAFAGVGIVGAEKLGIAPLRQPAASVPVP